jgi:predicted ATPase
VTNTLKRLAVRNYRSLADIDMDTGFLHVLAGPNGAGKSTFLDTIWFIRDCAIRGVETASSDRGHGIGLRWDGAEESSNISIAIETDLSMYEVQLGYSSGRIESFVGETLKSKSSGITLVNRRVGSDKAVFYDYRLKQEVQVPLKDPERLALTRYGVFAEESEEASEMDSVLRFVRFYPSRVFDLFQLKRFGSESSYQVRLWDRGQNLWSVLRNLHDRRGMDERYDTIIELMRDSFPSFKDLYLEQTGPTSVYGYFLENQLRNPVAASGVADGHLQMLILLAALFAEGRERESIILFDEPEISLHPHAVAIFAKAVKLATQSWNKQVFIATHSRY